MKFFIDFEATQYSEYIISIGCVSETGREFSTLVKPPVKKKLTSFVTTLTGITDEMLASAPNADAAFLFLMEFVKEESCGDVPEYYCYGSSDAKFIERTLHKMNNFYAMAFAQSVMGSLHDYSEDVKKYFNNIRNNAPSLFRTYLFLTEQEDGQQKHDALEDAQMLKVVCERLTEVAEPEDINKIYSIKVAPKPTPKGNSKAIVLPQYVIDWTHLAGKKNLWKVCQFSKLGGEAEYVAHGQNNTVYFVDIDQAVYWVNYYIKRVSLKNKEAFKQTKKSICEAIRKNEKYCGLNWKKAEDFNEEV